MDWKGKPRWDGKTVKVDLTVYIVPYVAGIPFCLLLEGTNDPFIPVFSSEEKLTPVMENLQKTLGITGYEARKIKEVEAFSHAVLDSGVRLMLDPQILGPHHTRWLEVIRDGDQFRYIDSERN